MRVQRAREERGRSRTAVMDPGHTGGHYRVSGPHVVCTRTCLFRRLLCQRDGPCQSTREDRVLVLGLPGHGILPVESDTP